MDSVLEDYVTPADLKHYEQQYHEEMKTGQVQPKTQFEYAWCLVRSRYAADIRRGVLLMEDLFHNGDTEAKRDYLFYLAVGNTKLKEYAQALKFVKAFLNVEPANRQAQELEGIIKSRMKKEGMMGMAIVGGAALAVSGLVGLGIALAKR
ncbi:mitochondrial fission 1 protein-like [Ornithodoros turicata]|uniref:Mitochondrial fission 1 protein n=1 Tax=Ornithodoros turicata TaxID=34597 RepID=A0A2R5LNB5_9ACAR